MEPIDADASPGQNPGAPNSQYWELGTWGWVVAPGPSPAPKGIPDVRCGGRRVSRVASVVAGALWGPDHSRGCGIEGWVALLARLPCGWQG